MIKNSILVPIDISSPLKYSPLWAIELAKKFDVPIHFLSVIKPIQSETLTHTFVPQNIYHNVHTRIVLETKQKLDDLVNSFNMKGLKYKTEVKEGIPFFEILRASIREKSDLILLTNRGITKKIARHILGMTSYKLVQNAPCPVLSIRDQQMERYCFKKILVAIDFSDHSKRTFRFMLEFAHHFGSTITLLNVIDTETGRFLDGQLEKTDLLDRLLAKSKDDFSHFLSEEKLSDIEIYTQDSHGKPAEEILKYAEKLGADLIAVGSHGRTSYLMDLLLGNTSYYVVRHAKSSILSFRPSRTF